MSGGIPIGRIFGISVRLHYSWFFIFALITWALAANYFPTTYPAWSSAEAITAGVVTSLLFFGSVLAHELMHSIVANHEGLPVHNITLFIFGGVSELTQEPASARDEFWMALVGPLTSVTFAPRRLATRARLKPILPDERFEMKRTGSIGSCVGPAVIKTCSPRKSFASRTVLADSQITGISARRPGPSSPQASGPVPGPTTS